MSTEKFDVFISHASEDKDLVVRPLAKRLTEENITVWFDETSLNWGDSLSKSIGKGLQNATFGIVIFSPNFFKKKWAQLELEALIDMTKLGETKILPLRYQLSHEELAEQQPILSGKVSRSWEDGLDVLVGEIKKLLSNIEESSQSDPEHTESTLDQDDENLFKEERGDF